MTHLPHPLAPAPVPALQRPEDLRLQLYPHVVSHLEGGGGRREEGGGRREGEGGRKRGGREREEGRGEGGRGRKEEGREGDRLVSMQRSEHLRLQLHPHVVAHLEVALQGRLVLPQEREVVAVETASL